LLDCIVALRERDCAQVGLVALADGPLIQQARALGANTQVIEPPAELAELGESGGDHERARTLWSLTRSSPTAARFLAELRGALTHTQPDVVHTNGMKAHLLAGILTPSRSRLVIHLHDFIGARRASKWLLPAFARVRRGAVFIANSRAVAEDFSRLAPGADVRTIYNVVDTEYFRPGPVESGWLASRASLIDSTQGTTSFGLVATYARWKGHALFIEAAGLLRAAHPDLPLRFYVIGGPIYKTIGSQVHASELTKLARASGIASCFGLVPFQDDIARVYRSLSVVVHASTQPEPFGRTIVEGMACERTVVVARAGGAAELFNDGENALGYEPGNVAALVQAMKVTLDPELRLTLGRSARAHAARHFGRSRLAPELLRAYSA
jgi:glycosyltransferase involved in cell wall biosynthesis